jgi:hypothetical protein
MHDDIGLDDSACVCSMIIPAFFPFSPSSSFSLSD